MTTETRPQSASRADREDGAALTFGALLALAAGWAGVLVAAAAVGLERAWSGRRGGQPARAAQARDRYADALAWLEQDRAQRAEYRRRRREWWQTGAQGDPPKPAPPGQRFGTWLRRKALGIYVAWTDFRTGFAAGWQAADQARRDGAGVREVARTRPDQEPAAEPAPAPPNTPPAPPEPGRGEANPNPAAPTAASSPDPEQPPPPQANNTSKEGDPDVTAPADASTPVQGDSNAAVMRQYLERIRVKQQQISDLTDQLSALRGELADLNQAATEFAQQTGQAAETRQALDASGAVVDQLGQQVGSVSDSVVEAEDQVNAAETGLRTVEHAEDVLTSAGADGRAVAAATNA